jgi:hypothetical protein
MQAPILRSPHVGTKCRGDTFARSTKSSDFVVRGSKVLARKCLR